MGLKLSKQPLTADQRRGLGHLDFLLGYSALTLGFTSVLGSKLSVNLPQAPEALGVSAALFFATAVLGIALSGYNLSKSTQKK